MRMNEVIDKDVPKLISYNCRDADLHVNLAEEMNMCGRICMLAGASSSTL